MYQVQDHRDFVEQIDLNFLSPINHDHPTNLKSDRPERSSDVLILLEVDIRSSVSLKILSIFAVYHKHIPYPELPL